MIITIGRECGCNADLIGRSLAAKYDIPYYARAEIEELAIQKGLYDRYPFFFDEMPINYSISSLDEEGLERVRNTPKKVLTELFGDQDCVLVGRAGNAAFKDRADAVSVFLAGDLDYRIRNMMKMIDVNEKKAKKTVYDNDQRRNQYNTYYTGRARGYADDYDLCIDVTRLDTEGVIQIIDSYVTAQKRGDRD